MPPDATVLHSYKTTTLTRHALTTPTQTAAHTYSTSTASMPRRARSDQTKFHGVINSLKYLLRGSCPARAPRAATPAAPSRLATSGWLAHKKKLLRQRMASKPPLHPGPRFPYHSGGVSAQPFASAQRAWRPAVWTDGRYRFAVRYTPRLLPYMRNPHCAYLDLLGVRQHDRA